MNKIWFIIFLGTMLSFPMATLLVYLIRRVGMDKGLLAVPNARSSHTKPTPTSGGLAIVIVIITNLLICSRLINLNFHPHLFYYLIGGACISMVSWLDDMHPIRNRYRFAVHTLAAALIVFVIGRWRTITLPVAGEFDLHWLAIPLSIMWLVGLTNAYNFMDGIDGIAGSQAVVAGIGWALVGWWKSDLLIELFGLTITSASLGFLWHNWPPARIFMGDVGSAFLGFSFAFLGIFGAILDSRLALAGLLFVWPFVFDSMFTFFRRLKRGEDVFSAHRSHLYQRLVITGCSHRFVTSLYIALACWGVAGAILWLFNDSATGIALILMTPFIAFWLWRFVVGREHAWSSKSIPKVSNVLDQTDPVSR